MNFNDARPTIVEDASKALQAIADEQDKKSAKFYVKVMQRIMSKGEAYLSTEPDRLQKLIESQISDGKKEEFKRRLNILASFPKAVKEDL